MKPSHNETPKRADDTFENKLLSRASSQAEYNRIRRGIHTWREKRNRAPNHQARTVRLPFVDVQRFTARAKAERRSASAADVRRIKHLRISRRRNLALDLAVHCRAGRVLPRRKRRALSRDKTAQRLRVRRLPRIVSGMVERG